MLLRIILVTNLSLKAIPVCIHRKHFHFGASVPSSVLDVDEHIDGNLLLLASPNCTRDNGDCKCFTSVLE